MANPHSVAVIVGSLRKEAFSLRIANALAKQLGGTVEMTDTEPGTRVSIVGAS